MVGVRWENHTNSLHANLGPNVSAEDRSGTGTGSLSELMVTIHICSRDFTVVFWTLVQFVLCCCLKRKKKKPFHACQTCTVLHSMYVLIIIGLGRQYYLWSPKNRI